MSVGVVGAFVGPGAIRFKQCLPPYLLPQGGTHISGIFFPIRGNYTIPLPFSLRVTPLSSTADEWPSCAKEVSGTRL